MSNYEELETAESPEEVEESAGGEKEIEIYYEVVVTHSGPEWPKVRLTEDDMEMTITLANECTMDVVYSGFMSITTERTANTLTSEELAAIAEEHIEIAQERVDSGDPDFVAEADLQVVNADNGEPIEGLTFGTVSRPAEFWSSSSDVDGNTTHPGPMGVNQGFVGLMREQNNVDQGNDDSKAAFQHIEEAVIELIGEAGRAENLRQTTQSAIRVLSSDNSPRIIEG